MVQADMMLLEGLVDSVRATCAAFHDKRRGTVNLQHGRHCLPAFSLFFMQSELFLSYQHALEGGCKTSNC